MRQRQRVRIEITISWNSLNPLPGIRRVCVRDVPKLSTKCSPRASYIPQKIFHRKPGRMLLLTSVLDGTHWPYNSHGERGSILYLDYPWLAYINNNGSTTITFCVCWRFKGLQRCTTTDPLRRKECISPSTTTTIVLLRLSLARCSGRKIMP